MPEDWTAVAAEVELAIRSVGDISQPNGYPATLRRETIAGGVPWDPTSGTPTITYTTLRVLDFSEEQRDRDGTLIGVTKRTLTVGTGAGVVPGDDDTIAVGIEAADASESSAWVAITAVRPLSPAGVDLLYEVDLQV